MKRKLLLNYKLLALLAMFSSVSGFAGGDWVPSEVGEGEFYLYNVGGDAFLKGGTTWGTRATLSTQEAVRFTLSAASDGGYYITSTVYSSLYLGSDGYVDNGTAASWTFTAVDGLENTYTMTTSSIYLYGREDTKTSVGDLTGTEYDYWQLVTRENMIAHLSDATSDNPIDATFLMDNPDFSPITNTSLWNSPAIGGYRTQDATYYNAEKWNTTFDCNQTITDLPNGTYRFYMQGFYRVGDGANDPSAAASAAANGSETLNAVFYANEYSKTVMSLFQSTRTTYDTNYASSTGYTINGTTYYVPTSQSRAGYCFNDGEYSDSLDFTVIDGTLTIGVKNEVTNTYQWCCWDNFRLTYYGETVDLSLYEENLASSVAQAEALEGTIPEAAYAILSDTVTKYNTTYTTAEEYSAAVVAINAAYTTAAALQSSYAEYSEYYNYAKDFYESTAAEDSVKEVMAAALAAADEAAEAATTSDEIDEALETLETATLVYVPLVTDLAEGVDSAYATFLVANPSCTESSGWSKDSSNASASYNVSNSSLDSDDYSGNGVEFWTASAQTNVNAIYQTINNLPAGIYTVTAIAMGQNSSGSNDAGLYLFANDGQTQVTTSVWGAYEVDGIVGTDGTLTIGLYMSSDNANRWVAIANVNLYYKGVDVSVYATQLAALVAQAKALAEEMEGTIPSAYIDLLSEDVDDTDFTEEDYTNAISVKSAQITTASTLVDSYTEFYVWYNYAKDFYDATDAEDEDRTTMSEALTSAESTVESATTVDEITSAQSALETALNSYVPTVVDLAEDVDSAYATFLVDNPTCTESSGWSRSSANNSAYYVVTNSALNSDDYEGSGIEFWTSTSSIATSQNAIYQTISNLPVGKYKVTAIAMGRDQSLTETCGAGLYLMANDSLTEVTTAVWGAYEVTGTVGSDGTLTIGLYLGEDNENNWIALANVNLYYLGSDLSIYAAELEALYQEAQTLAEELDGEIPSSYISALNSTVDYSTFTTADEYLAEIAEKKALIEGATDLADSYAEINGWYSDAEAFYNATTASDDDKTTMSETLSTAKTDIEGALTTEELDSIYSSLIENTWTYAAVVTGLVDGVESVDVTFLGSNMDFTGSTIDPWISDVASGIGNFRLMDPDTTNLLYDGNFIERYITTSYVENYANSKLVYQTLSGMPKGGYTFTARSFNRDAWFNDGRTPIALELFVNDGTTEANSETLDTVFTVYGSSSDGSVSFGIQSTADFNTDWNGIADAHLYYTGVPTIELDESSETYPITYETYANVTLARTLKADSWNTFCLPFAMTAEEVTTNGIGEIRALASVEVEEERAVLNFEAVSEIEAGKPYIVKPSEEVTQISVSCATISAVEPDAYQANDVSMTGSYVKSYVPLDAYFISDNVFYLCDEEESVIMKGFRAYINVEETSDAAGVAKLLLNIDDNNTTVIEGANANAEGNDDVVDVYALTGAKLKSNVKRSEALNGLSRGIYIVGDLKVIK